MDKTITETSVPDGTANVARQGSPTPSSTLLPASSSKPSDDGLCDLCLNEWGCGKYCKTDHNHTYDTDDDELIVCCNCFCEKKGIHCPDAWRYEEEEEFPEVGKCGRCGEDNGKGGTELWCDLCDECDGEEDEEDECNGCGETFPVSELAYHPDGAPRSTAPYCKSCENADW